MRFGPFELQACGENDYTMKSLGLLAFRPDLRERLICRLAGDGVIGDGEPSSILFFARIGENFFREAIEREPAGPPGEFELRCNLALGLPSGFRWRRNANGRLTQPAKWQKSHVEDMLEENRLSGSAAMAARLRSIQDDLNTEPDVVLPWGNRLTIIEVKVLSGQGVSQVDRQRRLAEFLVAMTGLERADLFLLGPAGCKLPTDPSCRLLSWKQVADWFDDVPEIADYIRHSAFFYAGSWRTMLAPAPAPPGKTAWDLMLAPPFPVPQDSADESPVTLPVRPLGPAECVDDSDAWAFQHLGHEYFAQIVNACRHNCLWPLRTIWVGVLGNAFIEKKRGKRVDPNWMIEDPPASDTRVKAVSRRHIPTTRGTCAHGPTGRSQSTTASTWSEPG